MIKRERSFATFYANTTAGVWLGFSMARGLVGAIVVVAAIGIGSILEIYRCVGFDRRTHHLEVAGALFVPSG